MVAGADSIEDLGLLRHGGMSRLFTRAYAPSTLGSFLRAFTFGHVRQLDAVAARFLARLAAQTPLLTGHQTSRGPGVVIDVDDTIIEVHGYAKQGAGFGYSKVRGLNALLATVSTPSAAPVIVAQRLRKRVVRVPAGREAAGRRRRRAGRPAAAGQPAAGADGLGVLRPRRGRRRHRRRLRHLGHRPTRRDGEGRDRPDQRGCVDPDRLSRRSVRRAVGPLDLPRRDRRDQFHRLRRAETVRAGARPAGRARGSPSSTQPGKTGCSTCGGSTHSSPPAASTRWPRTRPTVVTPSSNTSTPT